MAYGVDAGVDSVQPPDPQAVRDRVVSDGQGDELGARDDAVAGCGEGGDPLVGVRRTPIPWPMASVIRRPFDHGGG